MNEVSVVKASKRGLARGNIPKRVRADSNLKDDDLTMMTDGLLKMILN
jgi:hypothetical protein